MLLFFFSLQKNEICGNHTTQFKKKKKKKKNNQKNNQKNQKKTKKQTQNQFHRKVRTLLKLFFGVLVRILGTNRIPRWLSLSFPDNTLLLEE